MLSGKQRSYLKKMAHELDPTVYIGKSGLTENIKKEMLTGFEARELVKVKIRAGYRKKIRALQRIKGSQEDRTAARIAMRGLAQLEGNSRSE